MRYTPEMSGRAGQSEHCPVTQHLAVPATTAKRSRTKETIDGCFARARQFTAIEAAIA
jgi:hypothetical protein